MFFRVGASQVGAKIGPKIDFGGLWTPLCNTLGCCWLDVVLESAFARNNGIRADPRSVIFGARGSPGRP